MKRIKIAVIVVACVFAVATAGEVFATTIIESEFRACLEAKGSKDSYAREECCEWVGGSWVTIRDDKGNWIDAYCYETESGGATVQQPDPTPTPQRVSDPRVGTTTGTYQPPAPTTSPTTTGTTSGTASR